LSALRDDERAAESVGVNTLAAKVGVMLISAGLAGLAGALFAINQTFVSPQSAFDVSYSVLPVLAATLGGIGTIAGPVIGTVAWSTLNELVREGAATSGSSSTLIYGLVLIALAIFLPFGVMGVLKRLRNAAILRSSRPSHPEPKSVPAPSRGGRP
jgi:branched-chain amino acid transport system permease protein